MCIRYTALTPRRLRVGDDRARAAAGRRRAARSCRRCRAPRPVERLARVRERGDIWIVDPDGENLESVTHGPARGLSRPGRRREPGSCSSQPRPQPRPLDHGADGGLRRLTRNAARGRRTARRRSRRTAGASRSHAACGGNQEIYVMNLDGTGLRGSRATPARLRPGLVADGTQIAFWRALRRAKSGPSTRCSRSTPTARTSASSHGGAEQRRRVVAGRQPDRVHADGLARGDIWTMRRRHRPAAADRRPGARRRLGLGARRLAIAFSSDRVEGTPNLSVVVPAPRAARAVTKIEDDSGYREAEGAVPPAWQPVP